MRGPSEWDRGPDPHLKNHKKGFLAILVSIPWKITKLQSQHLMLGHHLPAKEMQLMAFCWCTDDGPHIVALDSFSSSPIMNKKQKQQQQKSFHTCSWTPSDKTVTNICLVDRNYKYRQLFPTFHTLFFNHRRKYSFTFLAC